MSRFVYALLTVAVAATTVLGVTDGIFLKFSSAGSLGLNRLTLHYLSNGDSVVLEDAQAKVSAVFSPDGNRIAYCQEYLTPRFRERHNKLLVMDINGSGRKLVLEGFRGNGRVHWAMDGMFYWEDYNGVYRTDSSGTAIDTVHRTRGNVPIPDGSGGYVDPSNGSWQISADGAKAIGTGLAHHANDSARSWAQLAIDLTTGEEWSPWAPCQGGVSPSGSLMSVSKFRHTIYRFASWDLAYQEYYGADSVKYGDTYDGCFSGPYEGTGLCPDYDTVVWIGVDLDLMFGVQQTYGRIPEILEPRFAGSCDHVFMFDTRNPRSELSGGSWLYDLSTHMYTKVAPLDCSIQDYYHTEVRPQRPTGIYPPVAYLAVDSNGTASPPATVVLFSTDAMTGPPILSSLPPWLTVTPSVLSPTEYQLTCSLHASALPDTDHCEDTVYVEIAGSARVLALLVVASIQGPTVSGPIVIHSPQGGEVYEVGDTILVEFSSDPVLVPGTLISLSVDAGEGYWLMTPQESYATGSHVTFAYCIPPELRGPGGTTLSTVSDQCIVRVSNYPNGYETESGAFAISAAASAGGPARVRVVAAGLSAIGRAWGPGIQLYVVSPQCGAACLLDLNGRVMHTFTLLKGRQLVTVPLANPGRCLLEATYGEGESRTVQVAIRQ